MNNTTTRYLTVAAILMAAVLVVGTAGTVTTKTAFAASNNSGNTVTIEECKNKGSASGFDTATNQECENLICTHPGNNATCSQEGVKSTTTPIKRTCEQCFTTKLRPEQITVVLGSASIAQACATFGQISEIEFRTGLIDLGIPMPTTEELIACLKAAGIVFA